MTCNWYYCTETYRTKNILSKQISIMIVDDHEMVIQGLKALLESQPFLQVKSTFNNGFDAIKQYPVDKPDIILMDINMPEINGFETAMEILKLDPNARIIMLSMEVSQSYMDKAINEGIKGYVSKSAEVNDLIDAIKAVNEGDSCFTFLLKIDEKITTLGVNPKKP